MARVVFAKAFQRHVDCPDGDAAGDRLGDVFAAYFERYPGVRSYVIDDTGAVRRHVTVFIDGNVVVDRAALSDDVAADATIHVFQALSGG